MKKILMSLSLVLILALAGCGTGTGDEDKSSESVEVAEVNEDSDVMEDTASDTSDDNMTDEDTASDSVSEETDSEESASEDGLVLTLEELSQYNGKDGNPAYVAVDGVIYDVTDVPQWNRGSHNGQVAGNDLSDEIANLSPHGKKVLEKLPVVGRIGD